MKHNTLLYIITLLVALSCSRDCHLDSALTVKSDNWTVGSGVVVGFDTQALPSTTEYNNVHILFFDQQQRVFSSYYYTDMKQLALTRFALGEGGYSVLAMFNTDMGVFDELIASTANGDIGELALPEIYKFINDMQQQQSYPDIVCGTESFEVSSGEIKQVIIPLSDKPISLIINSVQLHLNYPSTDMPHYTPSTRADVTPQARAIIEVCVKGQSTRVLRLNGVVINDSEPIEVMLPDGEYIVHIWSDYTHNPLSDLHYDTSNLSSISVADVDEYIAGTPHKEGFAATYPLTVSGSGSHSVDLYHPFAQYRVIATDLEEYIKLVDSDNYPPIEDLDIDISYEGFFPTAYDVTDSSLAGAEVGYSYQHGATVVDANSALIGSDYILALSSESSVRVTIIISTPEGKIISRQSGREVKYRAGYLTTLYGDFLTAGVGGVVVDTEWEDEYYVTF